MGKWRWVVHVARMVRLKNLYTFLVGEHQETTESI
jgi:hypothetical protein